VYERLVEYELGAIRERGYMTLEDLFEISSLTNTYQKVFPTEYPFLSQLRTLIEGSESKFKRELDFMTEIV
jgi:hypothetical protein